MSGAQDTAGTPTEIAGAEEQEAGHEAHTKI